MTKKDYKIMANFIVSITLNLINRLIADNSKFDADKFVHYIITRLEESVVLTNGYRQVEQALTTILRRSK